jgi:hypothetical protein
MFGQQRAKKQEPLTEERTVELRDEQLEVVSGGAYSGPYLSYTSGPTGYHFLSGEAAMYKREFDTRAQSGLGPLPPPSKPTRPDPRDDPSSFTRSSGFTS